MFKNILVPLDGSEFAEQALPLGLHLASSAHAPLHLVLAHRPVATLVGVGELMALPGDVDEELKARERGYLSEAARRAVAAGAGTVEFHETEGLAGPELCDAASRLGADLIVMATHGRGGMRRFWLGSVADYLVRHLSTPVLLVHPGADPPPSNPPALGSMLVALDLSADSQAILEPAMALARVTQSHLTLLHVVGALEQRNGSTPPFPMPRGPATLARYQLEAQRTLDQLATRVREAGVSAAARLVTGMSPAAGLLETLAEDRYDLIALTTHGAGGVRRLLLGSVADTVIRRAAKPVLVMRP